MDKLRSVNLLDTPFGNTAAFAEIKDQHPSHQKCLFLNAIAIIEQVAKIDDRWVDDRNRDSVEQARKILANWP